MPWVILATVIGLTVGAVLSRPILKATSSRARWTSLQPSDAMGSLISGGLVLLALLAILAGFGPLAAGIGAMAGAIGGLAWPAVKKTKGVQAWLRAAQGAAAGIIAVPLLLGVGLAVASVGGPFCGRPDMWHDLVGNRAFPAWAATVRSGNPEHRLAAIVLIRNSGGRTVPVMLDAVSNSVPQVRSVAVEALGELRPQGAFERISPLMADPDAAVREAAAGALAKLNDPRSFIVLFEAAGKSKNTVEPRTLGNIVSRLPGGRAAARACVLNEGECAGNENARFGAIESVSSMSGMGSSDVRPVLVALRDPSKRIRKSGLDACRNLMNEWTGANGRFFVSLTALDSLIEHQTSFPSIDPNELIAASALLLEDKDEEVRRWAKLWVPSMCEGSSGLNNVNAPRIGDPDSRIPRLNIQRLSPSFLRMLKSPDRDVAGSAARALAFLGDRRAIPVLKERDAAENSTYNCLYCIALESLGVGPLVHSTSYPGAPK